MIGSLNTDDKRVTIIGAGISGLLIAYALKKKGYLVSVYEKSNRCGGLIQTKHTPHGMVETAAHSLMVNDVVQSFMDELGVELIPVNQKSKARYIYRNGKMRKMPLTFLELISTLFHFVKKPKLSIPLENLSLEQWGNAYLGPAATKYLLAPFTAGIFACAPRELNARLAFPKLLPNSDRLSLFQFFKQRPKTSRPKMMAFKNGTEDFVAKLQAQLKNEIHLNSEISDLKSIEGNLILSVPTPILEQLVGAGDSTLVKTFPKIRYSPLIAATIFYSRDSFRKTPKGVGVLIPRGEHLRMLGCLFNSSSFSGRTQSDSEISLTAMFGGSEDPDALNLLDAELSELIDHELTQLLGTTNPPSHIEISRWQRAIPIYSPELSLYIDKLSQTFCSTPGRAIFSNYSGQISIRGMIETVHHL